MREAPSELSKRTKQLRRRGLLLDPGLRGVYLGRPSVSSSSDAHESRLPLTNGLALRESRTVAQCQLVGDRTAGDEVTYPDIDLEFKAGPGGVKRYDHKNGTPYPRLARD
jgi:hypothetical protein